MNPLFPSDRPIVRHLACTNGSPDCTNNGLAAIHGSTQCTGDGLSTHRSAAAGYVAIKSRHA